MINWNRKIAAHVYKDSLGWIFHLKASGIEQAQQIALERTQKEHPEILEKPGAVRVEFIQ
ncbi:hypothetical protein UFOVP353_45 [uncultured Caudovirales phage]|uniref:Uncharacterized protein n=1 Tax=uncultured Caudovirales phage TaxID=2100421 RepID=A0A6J5M3Z0_9CAUD|nr:hypothetical protein UFOVP353_45 [uncultured Caudovirales phage]